MINIQGVFVRQKHPDGKMALHTPHCSGSRKWMRADAILPSSIWPSPMAHGPSSTGSSHLRLHPGPILSLNPKWPLSTIYSKSYFLLVYLMNWLLPREQWIICLPGNLERSYLREVTIMWWTTEMRDLMVKASLHFSHHITQAHTCFNCKALVLTTSFTQTQHFPRFMPSILAKPQIVP